MIETAKTDDMAAYAVALNNGGAQHVLDALEPTPVNAEEDNGSMALFMGETGAKAETIEGGASDAAPTEDNGADFAA